MTYLAYPIDAAEADPGWLQTVEFAKDYLTLPGVGHVGGVYDPGDAFTVSPSLELGREIGVINGHALAVCDSLLAFLIAGVPTIGVPAEIERAIAQRKPVGILTDTRSWHLSGYGNRAIVGGLGDVKDVIRAMREQASNQEPRPDNEPLRFAQVDPDKWKNGREYHLPSSAHPGEDAGLDLVASETTLIEPRTFTAVPSGFAVELPEWGWGLVTGRSSTLHRGLFVKDAVIDSGYRGELFANCWNLTDEPITVEVGERIAQLIVLPNLTRDLVPVEVAGLSGSARGSNGFGSSGR